MFFTVHKLQLRSVDEEQTSCLTLSMLEADENMISFKMINTVFEFMVRKGCLRHGSSLDRCRKEGCCNEGCSDAGFWYHTSSPHTHASQHKRKWFNMSRVKIVLLTWWCQESFWLDFVETLTGQLLITFLTIACLQWAFLLLTMSSFQSTNTYSTWSKYAEWGLLWLTNYALAH